MYNLTVILQSFILLYFILLYLFIIILNLIHIKIKMKINIISHIIINIGTQADLVLGQGTDFHRVIDQFQGSVLLRTDFVIIIIPIYVGRIGA